jgi:hypothetical protein
MAMRVPVDRATADTDSVVLGATVRPRVPIMAMAVGRAIDALHLKREFVAVHYLGHRDGRYLSKQLTGHKPFTERDRRLLPIEVREALADGFCCHLGVARLNPSSLRTSALIIPNTQEHR